MKLKRHLLQYVHGLGARSRPRSKWRTRSGFATSGRAIVTPSQAPLSIAAAITDAVWKPPVESTGTPTARLTACVSARLIPSYPPNARVGRSHHQRKPAENGQVLKTR